MSLPDKHDTRQFHHFAHVAADGSVIAVTECAIGRRPTPTTDAVRVVDVTSLHPYDFTNANVTQAPLAPTRAIALLSDAELASLLAGVNRVTNG